MTMKYFWQKFRFVLLSLFVIPLLQAENTVLESAETSQESHPVLCVLDFSCIDIEGLKLLPSTGGQSIIVPSQNSLNTEDRRSINSVMQGLIRLMDSWDNSKTNEVNRIIQLDDIILHRDAALEVYKKITSGPQRSLVLGAEYLTGYLGEQTPPINCTDSNIVTAAMLKLQQDPDFPLNFQAKLAADTGVTHLVYGSVGDISYTAKVTEYYGIKRESVTYRLPITIKVVDLARQYTVFSKTYESTYTEKQPFNGLIIESNIYGKLMQNILRQVASDIAQASLPGDDQLISVKPINCNLTVITQGGWLFDPAKSTIYLDGEEQAKGAQTFQTTAGKHLLKIVTPGYKDYEKLIKITGDSELTIRLKD